MYALPSRFKLRALALLIAMPALLAAGKTALAENKFNASFLSFGGGPADIALDTFAKDNVALPGVHLVDVTINGEKSGQHDVRFEAPADGSHGGAQACMTSTLAAALGVNLPAYPLLAALAPDECADIALTMPGSQVSFDPGPQVLTVTVPQASMSSQPRGAVPPSQWDEGINAAMLDYRLSAAKNHRSDSSGNGGGDGPGVQWYASLQSGVNLGPWRFRTSSTINRDASGTHGQMLNSYVQRDLVSLRGQLTLGDSFTPGDVFDSVPFRGAQFASDDTMQPDSLRGYAPVVRGIAQSYAKVEIRQNGFLIYSTYVSPGPFAIDDMYSTTSNSDMEVTIIEADGQKRTFIQPYASIPTLLRQHAWKYRATLGQLRVPGASRSPMFVSASASHGLANETTVYGGISLSPVHTAASLGVARNMAYLGAVSLDLTASRTQDNNDSGRAGSGQAARLMYAKVIDASRTEIRAAAYRYSGNYRSLSDAVRSDLSPADGFDLRNRQSKLEATVSQNLGSLGSLYFTGSEQRYLNRDGKDRMLQLGYSTSIQRMPVSLNLNYEHRADGSINRQIALNLSIPLGPPESSTTYGSASFVSGSGHAEQRVGVFGTAFDDNRLSYSVDGSRSAGDFSGGASAIYRTSAGQATLTHNTSHDSAQTSLSATGGMVLHEHGLTLSQPLGDTIALVRAEGAADVGIQANAGVRTDSSGYAVVPHVTPYRANRISLTTGDLDRQVEIKNATANVVPTRGAVVMTPFEVAVGRLLLNITGPDGQPVPFGATVLTDDGREVGMVGPDGQSFATGAGQKGTLHVRWGNRPSESCSLSFALADAAKSGRDTLPEIDATCQPADRTLTLNSTATDKESTQ
ncbi:fimbria/pilus outer membrane usher protein [Paraherbaspirillum soli]|uniref:Fimbria/pilus outer membrane usher protein n=1 Tax=Paraherbaspirillum soli TaxID=631222 RepID=A0ABW0ME10_9BURK